MRAQAQVLVLSSDEDLILYLDRALHYHYYRSTCTLQVVIVQYRYLVLLLPYRCSIRIRELYNIIYKERGRQLLDYNSIYFNDIVYQLAVINLIKQKDAHDVHSFYLSHTMATINIFVVRVAFQRDLQ
jgi:hypothetical protein